MATYPSWLMLLGVGEKMSASIDYRGRYLRDFSEFCSAKRFLGIVAICNFGAPHSGKSSASDRPKSNLSHSLSRATSFPFNLHYQTCSHRSHCLPHAQMSPA